MFGDFKRRAESALRSDSLQARALTAMNLVSPARACEHPRILCYHAVYHDVSDDRFGVSLEQFRSHLQLAADRADGERRLEFTFDDNLRSHVDVAVPALQEAGLTATFFLNVELIGDVLSMADVDGLLEAGMSVGAHNAVHTVASQMSLPDFRRSVLVCAEFCDSIGQERRWAYPGGFLGSFTAEQDAILRDEGFWRYTTVEGDADGDRHVPQPRYVIRRYMTADHVEGIANGGLRALGTVKRARHQIARLATL